MSEHWVSKNAAFSGKIVNVVTGEVELPDGNRAYREVVEHHGGVAVVPLVGENVILIRQFRIALERAILEIPAGQIEGDECLEQRGREELEEEVGYFAEKLIPIGAIYPSVGYLTEKIHLFLAINPLKTRQRLEPGEHIVVVEMSLDEVREKLRSNAFEDGKTVVGLWALLAWLDQNDVAPAPRVC